MEIRANQLGAHLERTLAPIYLIHGDEPLLALEAGDAIRKAARERGVADREVMVVDPGFKWDAFVAANANLGLFSDRKLIDLRVPSGKPGTDGARALEAYGSTPSADNVLLVTLPRLDRAAQAAGWFTTLADAGVAIAVYPLDRGELPQWIGSRFTKQGQRVTREALEWMADRCEGNLFAARQEIEKLGLLLPEGNLAQADIEAAVVNVARYDVFALSEAWLSGDAERTLRIISGLQAEGEGLQLLLWQLVEDVHALAALHEAVASGTPLTAAVRNVRAWGKRQVAMERAFRRVDATRVLALMGGLADLDAMSKGIGRGQPWDEIRTLALGLVAKDTLSTRPLSTAASAYRRTGSA